LGFHAIVQHPESFACRAGGLTSELNRCSLSELFANAGSQSERTDRAK
jgi:hypothetical protein